MLVLNIFYTTSITTVKDAMWVHSVNDNI